jgi:hypothetical protein
MYARASQSNVVPTARRGTRIRPYLTVDKRKPAQAADAVVAFTQTER